MAARLPLSVVVCTKNEEARIQACLESIFEEQPDEIILVDGGSSDNTILIAEPYVSKVIRSPNSNLTRDRQIGIDSARNELIALIDADHRIRKNDLNGLTNDLNHFELDIVQAALEIQPDGFWCKSEAVMCELFENVPGLKKMIGVAPCIFRKHVFDHIRFEDKITSTIDDTDFMYRLHKLGLFAVGMGTTRVYQKHEPELKSYLRKFKWYGRGDGEFCVKHPERAYSMFFHLSIRYPFLYSWRALIARKPFAIPFLVMQGYVRLWNMIKRIIELKFLKNKKLLNL